MSDNGYQWVRIIQPDIKPAQTYTIEFLFGPRLPRYQPLRRRYDVDPRGPFTMPRCNCKVCQQYRRQAITNEERNIP